MNRKQSPAPRQAIALSYDGQAAPTLSAKGDAELAEAILAIARDYEVPIYENAELVRLLARRLTPEFRINRQAKVRHHEGTIDRVVLLQDRDRFTYRSYLRDDQKEPATFWILEFDARSGKRLSERQTDEDDYWRRRDADSQRADSGERNR
ncbi:EscU/YscU/HrcU family type III secretion system export apparatus switch protein [Pseudomonas aeruginosa]|nr:EscU/YscU/HrcU family type III secretion system export apparatus switch protein [Pseudomonas aeruginosa]